MTQNTTPFSSLRLSQNFGETLGVKKVLTTVPVGKPPKDRFFRTHMYHRLPIERKAEA